MPNRMEDDRPKSEHLQWPKRVAQFFANRGYTAERPHCDGGVRMVDAEYL